MKLRGKFLPLALLSLVAQLSASDVWTNPAFSTDAVALRQAAADVKADKDSEATVFLNELRFDFDPAGRLAETRHLIYRIENQQGVQNWAETSGRWQAWHQSKPELKARVITPEGTIHWLDQNTLNDVPVHQNAPDLYSDERRYGGPLPAIAPGAIVEEQVVTRDTAPLFAAGTIYRWSFGWSVPVNKTHVILTHSTSFPLAYQLHLLPEASVTKSTQGDIETIVIDQGPISAYRENTPYAPNDAVLYPELEFSTGSSWQKIASEYTRLTDDKFRLVDVQAILSKVNLKSGQRDARIRNIVAALHRNVRYTGVEFGESSLIPQFPAETLKRKYGDCKDKATLLVTLLRSAGIPAYLALLNAGPGQDVNQELAGMGMFDHAIVYVPASGTDPDLWIDATAQYSQVGTLPWMDYGRWALVVSDKTDSLKQIPEVTAAQVLHRETREFTLAEYGVADIAETSEDIGPGDAGIRDYYSGDTKQVREASENYVKRAYLADSLISIEHGDLSDLSKPALITLTTKGRRGNTDLSNATMAIRVEDLFSSFPQYFVTPKEDEKTKNSKSDQPKPRTVDWRITPFTTEWHYKITAPAGFKLRALPSDKNTQADGFTFSQNYSSNPDGTVVEALLRVESTSTRLTVQQAESLRDAVVKERNADPIFITFDHAGLALIAAGKMKEGLAAYRDVAAQHPKEAIYKAQYAQALLTAGLGEEARTVARQATALDPTSAVAFSTLANILKNDLIGRLLKKGMDYNGAVAAYKKAIELDPKDKDNRANLALLLEYDADGTRYAAPALLKDAVDVLRELKKMDEDYARAYDDNVLYDLWYSGDFQGLLNDVSALPATSGRKSLTLAAIASLQGVDAAVKKSLEITTDDQERSNVLVVAGNLLSRLRKYPECAALLAAGARGNSSEAQIARSAAIYAKTRPYEETTFEPNDPRSVVNQVMGDLLSGKFTEEEAKSLVVDYENAMDHKQFTRMMTQLKMQLGATGVPIITLADLAMSNMRYTVDGDDNVGYKIILESPGAAAQNVYVVRDGNRYKLAAFSGNSDTSPEQLAPLALRAIVTNNLAAARKWLDRARDQIHINTGDDPLSGQIFPHFWTKGQEADANAMRTAALVLLRSKQAKGAYLSELLQARDAAKTDIDRARLTLVLAYAYAAQYQWADMATATEQLMKAFPSSLRAFNLAGAAYGRSKRFDDWERLLQERTKAYPDELDYIRSAAILAAYRGQYDKSREIMKTILDKGVGTPSDWNLYAWYALFLPASIAQDSIDAAQRANDLSKGVSFPELHTLACIDAAAGRTSQARELLLKAMDAGQYEEPDSEVWFGLATIAEQYGVLDAAKEMYGRVEKPEFESPGETYALAQLHLAALSGKTRVATAK